MRRKNTLRLFLATTLLSASAVAQVRFCVGGALDHLSPSQRSACSAKLQAVRRLAAALHAPDEWHFVLVCGDEGWKDFASYTMGDANGLDSRNAETNIEERETFLRETSLDGNELQSLRGIIAHEIAVAALHSRDEIAIREEVERRSSIRPVTTAGI